MSPTILTFVSYALPASLIAGLIMWVGQQRQRHWSAAEYFWIYLPFLLVYAHVAFVFGDIDTAVAEMGFHPVAVVMIASTGGLFGGAALLPRLWVAEEQLNRFVLSSSSSFLVGVFCLKMFFLAVVLANPRSLTVPN